MKKEYLYGLIGLLGGILIAIIVVSNAVNSNNQQMMQMMGIRTAMNEKVDMKSMMHEGMSMDGMVNALKDKRNEEFDKEFITQMIAHHEGAIEMAELAKQFAFHEEIKSLADDIILAQTKEIEMMRAWRVEWGL